MFWKKFQNRRCEFGFLLRATGSTSYTPGRDCCSLYSYLLRLPGRGRLERGPNARRGRLTYLTPREFGIVLTNSDSAPGGRSKRVTGLPKGRLPGSKARNRISAQPIDLAAPETFSKRSTSQMPRKAALQSPRWRAAEGLRTELPGTPRYPLAGEPNRLRPVGRPVGS